MNYYTRQRILRKLAKSSYEDVQDKYTAIAEEAPDLIYNIATAGLLPTARAAFQPIPTLGGTIAHITGDLPSKEELKNLKEFSQLSILPPLASYRAAQRDMYVDNKLSKGKSVRKHRVAEKWGPVVNPVLLGLLGAVTGGLGAKLLHGDSADILKSVGLGTAIGSGLGFVANPIGRLAGLARGGRDDKRHAEYLGESVLGHYLLPGVGAYHSGRRARTVNNIFA